MQVSHHPNYHNTRNILRLMKHSHPKTRDNSALHQHSTSPYDELQVTDKHSAFQHPRYNLSHDPYVKPLSLETSQNPTAQPPYPKEWSGTSPAEHDYISRADTNAPNTETCTSGIGGCSGRRERP